MSDDPSVILRHSGYRAVIEPDRFIPGAYELVVDGTPQSHVNLEDPQSLFFEYIQRMGNVIDLIGEPGEPITAVHLGAGAMTLPRYIAVTRPGSRQQVIELEQELVDLVREHLPLPRGAQVRVRYGDAREVLGKLPSGLRGQADLVVIDIFSGARTPAHVTSVEFYREAVALLKPTGIVLVNIADGPPLRFARGQAATLAQVVPHAAVLAEAQVLKGRRFGNFVLVGSPAELPVAWLPRLMAAGPHPAQAVFGADFDEFARPGAIVTDQTALPSPSPSLNVFQVRRGG
ncbi:spermidine synthase [Gryllotalpicola ginsengisoli]|uniref:spermidine synthase n=1 Tax=Gryllotalpicola ginsengisoli TaxID=444608 RepID=UPI0003B4629C|nr:fused MFS/spermidine synthase [Gryllotalpicola ginsengisoli]